MVEKIRAIKNLTSLGIIYTLIVGEAVLHDPICGDRNAGTPEIPCLQLLVTPLSQGCRIV